MDNWESFIKRLKSSAEQTLCNNKGGCAIVTAYVIVNHHGQPVLWLEPSCKRLEPSSSAFKTVIQLFTGDD